VTPKNKERPEIKFQAGPNEGEREWRENRVACDEIECGGGDGDCVRGASVHSAVRYETEGYWGGMEEELIL